MYDLDETKVVTELNIPEQIRDGEYPPRVTNQVSC